MIVAKQTAKKSKRYGIVVAASFFVEDFIDFLELPRGNRLVSLFLDRLLFTGLRLSISW